MYGLKRMRSWLNLSQKEQPTQVTESTSNKELTFIVDFIRTNYSSNDIKHPFITDKVKLIFTEADLQYIKDNPSLARVGLGVRISMCLLNPEASRTHFTIFKVTEIIEEDISTENGEFVYSLSIITQFVLEKKKDSNITTH